MIDVLQGRQVVLSTGSWYYSSDKKLKKRKIEDIIDINKEYVNICLHNNYWSIPGFLISETEKKGQLRISFYHIRNIRPKQEPLEIVNILGINHNCYKDDEESLEIRKQIGKLASLCQEKYSIIFDKNGIINFEIDKNKNIITNITEYYQGMTKYNHIENHWEWVPSPLDTLLSLDFPKEYKETKTYLSVGSRVRGSTFSFYWYGKMLECQDLNDDTWFDKPTGKLSEKTKEILKRNGFPEKLNRGNNTFVPWTNFQSLQDYFYHKQNFENIEYSKETIKMLKLFEDEGITKENPCKIISNKKGDKSLLFQVANQKIIFNLKKGLKGLAFINNTSWTHSKKINIVFTEKEKQSFIEQASKFPVLEYFTDFLKDRRLYKKQRDIKDQNPIWVFLKYIIKYPERQRFVENLAKFHPDTLFNQGLSSDEQYFYVPDSKFFQYDHWKLTQQLNCNKKQLNIILEQAEARRKNFLNVYIETRNNINAYLLKTYQNTYYGNWNINLDEEEYKTTITEIPDEVVTLSSKYPNYFLCISNKYFANSKEFLKFCKAFSEYSEKKEYWQANMQYRESEYNDYLSMRKQAIGNNLINEKDWPLIIKDKNSLSRLHNEIMFYTDKIKYLAHKSQLEEYQQRLSDMKEMNYEDDNFIIKMCENPEVDLPHEGTKLHHCVGGYVSKVLDENNYDFSYIFFLRKKSQPDEPFVTINLDRNKKNIIQIHGVDNWWLGNWPEAIPVAMHWLKKNKISCDDRILTSTAKGYRDHNAPCVELPKID